MKICNSSKVSKGHANIQGASRRELFFTSVAGAYAGSTSFAEEPLRALFPCPWWAFASRPLSCWSLGCWSTRSLNRSTCSCDPAVVETRHRDLRIRPPRPRDLRRCRRRLRRQGGLHVCDGAWDERQLPLQVILSGACTMHRLTERGCQTVKRPFGSAGRRMAAPECGSSHV